MMCSGAAPRERTTSFSADATAVVCGSIPPTAAADAAEPSGEATEPASAGRTGSAPARLCSASSKIVRTSLLSTASLRSTSDVGKRVAGNSDASATPKSWNTHRGIAAAADQARQNSSAVLWERYTFMGKHDTVPRPWKSVRVIRSMEPTFMTAVLADGKQHPQALPPLRAGKTSARPLISLIYQAKREVYPAGVIAFRGGAAHTGRHRFCHDKEGRKRS